MANAFQRGTAACLAAATLLLFGAELHAQLTPYRPDPDWGRAPGDREWGAVSGVWPAEDGGLWMIERCGQNICVGSDVDPVVKLDADGDIETQFGGGLMSWPHGLSVDDEGNVWVTDAEGFQGDEDDDLGHAVFKFSPDGELLMTLGEPGVPGDDEYHFNQPNQAIVGEDGAIFVADGHGAGGNNRVVKYDADGNYLMEWGETGGENGEFRDPHTLAIDSEGRLFVGDRSNSRIQIFTQDGEFLEEWTQFGRPSGLYITDDDILLSADSESNVGRNQRGWARGIYIGSAQDGWVRAFIPDDTEPNPDESGTSFAEWAALDDRGYVYSGEIGPQNMRRWIPLYPLFDRYESE